jgi:cysteine synthase B
MNELWETKFFDKDVFDEFIHGTARDSIEGILALSRNFGLLAGPTAGLQYYVGLKRLQKEDKKLEGTGQRKKAAFIVCDRVEPYMTYIKKYYPELFTTSTTTRARVEALMEEDIDNSPVITPEELSNFMTENEVMTIDIRGNFAFNMGHIPGAINILDEMFGQMIEEGPIFDKNKKVLITCGIGMISRKYAAFLKTQGYDAYSLEGGINACKRAGIELASNKETKAEEHSNASVMENQVAEKGVLTISGFKKRKKDKETEAA